MEFSTDSAPFSNLSNSITYNPYEHGVISLEQKKEKFISEVDELFRKSLEARENSKIEQMKAIWSRHKLARFVTGAGLAVGAVAATASGAFIVAGGLLGARAVIGAIGGYLLSDSALNFLHSRISTDKYIKLLSTIQSAEKRSDLDDVVNSMLADIEYDDFNARITEAEANRKRFQRVNTIVSGTVAATFAVFGGTSVVEAASENISKSAEIINATHGKTLDLLKDTIPGKTNPINISDIFQDIHHDHPNQGYLTLEQTIRRMEGLKVGIPLDNSSELKSLNTSVYRLVRDNNGPIIKAMKELGVLAEGQSIDDIAPSLSQDQIRQITERAYSVTNESSLPSKDILLPTDASEGIPTSPSASDITVIPVSTLPENNPSTIPSWTWKLLGGGTAGIGALLGIKWLINRRQKHNQEDPAVMPESSEIDADGRVSINKGVIENSVYTTDFHVQQPQAGAEIHVPVDVPYSGEDQSEKEGDGSQKAEMADTLNTPTIPENIIPINDTSKTVSTQTTAPLAEEEKSSQIIDAESSVNSPGDTTSVTTLSHVHESEPTQENQESSSKRGQHFYRFKDAALEEFGFILDLENSSRLEDGGISFLFRKDGTFGNFRAVFTEDSYGDITIGFSWIDGTEEQYTTTHKLLDFEDARDILERLYQKTLIERDIIKNKELLTLNTVEITNKDLGSIYKQLENPYVLSHGTETGGYWFQSCYGMRNGILKFENLVNPTLEQMRISGAEFAVTSEYIGVNTYLSLVNNFDALESRLIYDAWVNTALKSGQKKTTIMDGAINHYNWHKHPGTLYHPSWLDINHLDMGRGRFERQPNLQVLTWGIVNELPKNSPINEKNKPSNSIIFRSSEYKGSCDYIMYFWKIHRNEENKDYGIEDLIPLDVYII